MSLLECSQAAPHAQALGAIVLSGMAAIADLRTRRIPNALTVCGAAIGLLVASMVGVGCFPVARDIELFNAFATMTLTLLLGFAFFTYGLLGGGDAKLLAAVGAWVGFPALAYVVAYTLAAAVIMIVVACAARGKLAALLRTVLAIPGSLFLPGLRRHADADLVGVTIPLGVAICLGTFAWGLHARLDPWV